MEKSNSQTPFEMAKEEYYFCQNSANDIDQQTLTFKNWSIIFSIALLGWAANQDSPFYILSATLSALIFWYSEGLGKKKQKYTLTELQNWKQY